MHRHKIWIAVSFLGALGLGCSSATENGADEDGADASASGSGESDSMDRTGTGSSGGADHTSTSGSTDSSSGTDEGGNTADTDDGGSTGEGDGGSTSGGSGEVPSPVRILPLGDSLTFGTSASAGSSALEGGYRIHLYDLLADAGYDVDYVGTLTNGPESFDGDHESEPGASIAVVGEHWATATAAADPHVVLLMAGTNDQLGITADQPPEMAAAALGELIDRILADEPGVVVVVAQVPPLISGLLVEPDRPARIDAYNALLPGVVESRKAQGEPVFLADLSTLPATHLGDGIHPSSMEGYDAMAELWLASVVEGIETLAP